MGAPPKEADTACGGSCGAKLVPPPLPNKAGSPGPPPVVHESSVATSLKKPDTPPPDARAAGAEFSEGSPKDWETETWGALHGGTALIPEVAGVGRGSCAARASKPAKKSDVPGGKDVSPKNSETAGSTRSDTRLWMPKASVTELACGKG